MNGLPRVNKNSSDKKKNLYLAIKPTDDKEYYRFRLLAFNGIGTDRSYPFIERYIHTHWGKTDDGKSVIDGQVVCPVTKWVHVDGDRYDACPICKVANQYFVAFKDSQWKDKAANKKAKEFGRKYEAIVPVYVVQDPTYPANNGKFRAIVFNNKDEYKALISKIQAVSANYQVFNGGEAVDCCIHMKINPKKVNEGKPNEYIYNEKVIDKIIFSNKPYSIAAINKESIDNFGFDDEYYQASTKSEIDDFYNRFVKMSNDDIPEDDSAPVVAVPTKTPVKMAPEKKAEVAQVLSNNKVDDVPDESLDDLIDDVSGSDERDPEDLDVTEAEMKKDNKSSFDNTDIDDLLNGLDI